MNSINVRKHVWQGSVAKGWLILLCLGMLACVHKTEVRSLSPAQVAAQTDATVRRILEESADSLNSGLRRQALSLLIATDPAPGGGAWGLRGRWDPSPSVQIGVIHALSQRGAEAESQALLRQLTEQAADALTSGYAALALVHGPDTELATWLMARARSIPAWSRGPLLLAATQAGSSDAAVALQTFLQKGDLPLDLAFFEALGQSGLTELAPLLATRLPQLEPELQLSAAATLLMLNPDLGRPVFTEVFAGQDEERILEAIDMLVPLNSDAAESLLFQVRNQGEWPHALATAALVQRGSLPLLELKDMLEGEDRELQVLAAQAATLRGQQEADVRGRARLIPALRHLLDATDPANRAAGASALGALGDLELLPLLLEDGSALVRFSCAAALWRSTHSFAGGPASEVTHGS